MMKEKYHIANPESGKLGEMLGISKERQNEIADHLDLMVKKSDDKGPRVVYMSSVIDYIENFCETKEEVLYAILNHTYWTLLNRRMLTPELASMLTPELANYYRQKYPTDNLKK